MAYKEEIDAIQRWIWATASLKSYRLSEAPPNVSRPAILWEPPARSRERNLGRYSFVNRVQQYGKLYVSSFDQLADLQDALTADLENKVGVLPVFDQAGQQIGRLKQARLVFQHTETLDVPLYLEYEATYARTRPAVPPAATHVGTKITKGDLENGDQ